jgi:glycosyltransferase involved in cell wall biosynthesis
MSAAVGLFVPVFLALIAVATLLAILRVHAVIPQLATRPAQPEGEGPRVSIIVAARDEERFIRPAVASLLGQEYHDVELIVVDDRSTDRTGKILDAMAAKTERLSVVHITELPSGWLGKNHALHSGAARATGTLLLFIDGDIMLHRTAVSRAVRVFDEPGADHVTVGPQMELPTWPLKLVVGYFLTWGAAAARLWLVEDPRSSAYIGVGAFNMVRASSYKAVGGHTRIAMRPDDDLMLGKILKKNGFQTRLFFGNGMVGVEWYRSVGEALLGFRKNAFSVLNYSVPLFVLSMIGNILQNVLPFVAVFFTNGTPQLLFGITIAALMAAYALTMYTAKQPLWLTLLYPVAALAQSAMVVIAVMRTLRAGGIDWRGTFYPLDQLRANRV